MRMIDAMQQKNGITSSFKGTYEEFVVSLIGEIGVDKEYCGDMIDTSSSIVESIETQRDSEMGVSLDEEGINMMKYQKSYNAAARMMTVLDEAVDTIINKMGVVGR
jgi:flagellar hook-associated protein 1 FlgK